MKAYLNGGDSEIVAEHTEVESGKNSDRPALDKALAAARLHRASLVVSKVNRLTRSVALTSGHGDFRARYEIPRTLGGPLSQSEISNSCAVMARSRNVSSVARRSSVH